MAWKCPGVGELCRAVGNTVAELGFASSIGRIESSNKCYESVIKLLDDGQRAWPTLAGRDGAKTYRRNPGKN